MIAAAMLGVVSVVLWWMCHARRSRAPGGPSHCEEERVEEDFAVYMSPSGRQHKFPGYNQSRCDDLAAVIREEINQRWERMKSRHIIEKNRIEYETISKTPKKCLRFSKPRRCLFTPDVLSMENSPAQLSSASPMISGITPLLSPPPMTRNHQVATPGKHGLPRAPRTN